MKHSDTPESLAGTVARMRIFVFALLAGCGAFMVFAIVFRMTKNFPQRNIPILSIVLLGQGALSTVLSFVVPKVMLPAQRKEFIRRLQTSAEDAKEPNLRAETSALCGLYRTQMIIQAALVEGGVFACIIAYMTEGLAISLVGAILFMALTASRFPTIARLEQWLREQLDVIAVERAQS